MACTRGAGHGGANPHTGSADDPADGCAEPRDFRSDRHSAATRRHWYRCRCLVVETMRGVAFSRLVMPLLAMLALTFLVAMVVIGAQPIQRQLVKFEANGVLHIEPREVMKITLGRAGRQVALTRSGEGGWTSQLRGVVEPVVAVHLDTAVKMLHGVSS